MTCDRASTCFTSARSLRTSSIGLATALIVGLSGWSSGASAVDLSVLRDTICEYETRGERIPDEAVGASGELGRCQIKIGTARQVGFQQHPALLFIADVNRTVALTKLIMCNRKYVTVKGLAWCWNRGLRAGRVDWTDAYVIAVAALYQERMKLVAQR